MTSLFIVILKLSFMSITTHILKVLKIKQSFNVLKVIGFSWGRGRKEESCLVRGFLVFFFFFLLMLFK